MRKLIGLSLLVALPASAEETPSLIELARQVTTDGPIYAYDMTYQTAELTATGKIDPTQPEGSRVTIYTPEKSNWPKDFEKGLEEIDADADGDIWCTNMLEIVPSDAQLVSDDNGVARYSFIPKPENKEDKKFMKHLTGTIDVDMSDGSVLNFRMASQKSFKPHMMVKINSFDMSATCERAPDGRTFMAEMETKVSGSAAMQTFNEGETRKITALYPTR